ncbi:MAG: hypothetical protein LBN08_07010 [Lactobacillales bacterium]|jgi:putative iron-only hydrogenase system regulator|nr:hypothetical protein [Lactobacillales bacterium]
MKRIAVVSAILEKPQTIQEEFNSIVAEFRGVVRGRMGIPAVEHGLSVICITLDGTLDEINTLTGRLGNLEGATVKTAISKEIA